MELWGVSVRGRIVRALSSFADISVANSLYAGYVSSVKQWYPILSTTSSEYSTCGLVEVTPAFSRTSETM